VACPSPVQCTAVDNDGGQLTFRPRTGRRIAQSTIDGAVGLDGPSGGSNYELDAVRCPISARCVAVDTLGNEVTFNPGTGRRSALRAIDPGGSLVGLSCPTVTMCMAVDSAGHEVAGDPAGGRWVLSTVPGAAALTAVACPSPIECIAVDSVGKVFLGSTQARSAVRQWLARLLARSSGRLATVRRARGSRLRFAAVFPARLSVRWYDRRALVGSGSLGWSRSRDVTLRIALNGRGRRLLGGSSPEHWVADATFTARGGAAVVVHRRFTLTR
jgi:hypothetical protein